MRHTPLLIIVLTALALVGIAEPTRANEPVFEASTIVEAPGIGIAAESTQEGPATVDSTVAGSFDVSMLIVVFLGLGGLFWMRRNLHSS